MKKILFLLSAISLTICIYAQDGRAEKVAKKVTNTWIEVCELDEATSKALYPVLLEKQKAIIEAKEKHSNDQEALKETKKEINKTYYKKIVAVVGKENSDKMKEYWKQQKNNK